MAKTLYDRINIILGRDCNGEGGSVGETAKIIGELEKRLEKALQIFEDLDEAISEHTLSELIEEGMKLTDIIYNYKPTKEG